MRSPFTYVSKTPLVVIFVHLETLLRLYDSVYPRIAMAMQQKLDEKFQILTGLSLLNERTRIQRSEASVELKYEKAQQNHIKESVCQNNPLSFRPARVNFQKVYERRRENGYNPAAPNNIKTKKIRGYITSEDMVRLERYKKKIYFDYDHVETYIRQARQKNRGEQPTGTPVKNFMLSTVSDNFAKLDDMYSPLSSRSITDYQEHFTFK